MREVAGPALVAAKIAERSFRGREEGIGAHLVKRLAVEAPGVTRAVRRRAVKARLAGPAKIRIGGQGAVPRRFLRAWLSADPSGGNAANHASGLVGIDVEDRRRHGTPTRETAERVRLFREAAAPCRAAGDAPRVLGGATNGASFLAYLRQMLAPAPRPGDTVTMDNLSPHTVAGVREAVAAAGARLRHLPPHSPDLNPVAMPFAQLKAVLRRARHRTQDALWDGIGDLIERFAPAECRRYLAHCGCRQSG